MAPMVQKNLNHKKLEMTVFLFELDFDSQKLFYQSFNNSVLHNGQYSSECSTADHNRI